VAGRWWATAYGSTSPLTAAGCVLAAPRAVAFAIRMQGVILHFEPRADGIQDRQKYDLQASEDRHEAAFNVFYPLELLCVIFAMNLLLPDHASHR
jgi:hypothetical protein